jgi:hypothetical protein
MSPSLLEDPSKVGPSCSDLQEILEPKFSLEASPYPTINLPQKIVSSFIGRSLGDLFKKLSGRCIFS